jgi:hypothetical protein
VREAFLRDAALSSGISPVATYCSDDMPSTRLGVLCERNVPDGNTHAECVADPLQPHVAEGDSAMPRVFALLLFALALGGALPALAQAQTGTELPVVIRIYDYSHVPKASLSHASRIVSRVYAQIGVRTDWVGVVRPKHIQLTSQPAQMAIVMLTQKMAARAHIEDETLGLAAVADQGMGRVAYVVYDRVRDMAQKVPMSQDDLLAYVIAHQIARLLLPAGSPFDTHSLRSNWTIDEIRQLRVRKLDFSQQQVSVMHNTIKNDAPTLAARAARAGSGQP